MIDSPGVRRAPPRLLGRLPARGVLPYAAALLLILPAAAYAQQGSASLTGRVTDAESGAPIPAAEVTVAAAGIRVQGAQDGTFRVQRVPPGEHLVEVRALGYARGSVRVTLAPGGTASVEIALEVQPVELEELRVDARREEPAVARGVWRSRAGTPGRHMGREDIEARRARRLTDLLRDVPGANVVSTGSRGNTVSFSRNRRGGTCSAAVYVNGVPFALSPAGLDEFDPEDVESIEVYSGPSQVPPQYRRFGVEHPPAAAGVRGSRRMDDGRDSNQGTASCGVVVVWTRTATNPHH